MNIRKFKARTLMALVSFIVVFNVSTPTLNASSIPTPDTDTTAPIINALNIKVPYGTTLQPDEIASISDDQDKSPILEVTSVEKIAQNENGTATSEVSSASTKDSTEYSVTTEEPPVTRPAKSEDTDSASGATSELSNSDTTSELSNTGSTAQSGTATPEVSSGTATPEVSSGTATPEVSPAPETDTPEVSNGSPETDTPEVSTDQVSTAQSNTAILFSTPGLYRVVLTGTDHSGNKAQKTITVTVFDDTKPALNGLHENFSFAETETTPPDYLNGVTAIDEIDGDLTSSIKVDDSKVRYGTAGTYEVTYTVSDRSGNAATAAVPVIVKDTTAPVITLSKTSITKTVIDSKPNYAYYVAKAEDTNDGNVKSSLTVDDSAVNYKKPGKYSATLRAQDKAGNTAETALEVIITAGWITKSRKLYYYSPDDGHLYHDWSKIDGKKHYFDPKDGHLLTGAQTIGGKQYLLDQSDGHMITGWQNIDGKKYYFSTDDGHMYHSWSNIDGKEYYFDPKDGHLLIGLQTIDDRQYLLDQSDGHQKTGWQTINGKKYYFSTDDGHMYHDWSNIDGEEYYFHNNLGYLLTGLCTINGKQYLLDSDDGHQKTGWQTIDGKKYYFSPDDGHMYHDWSNIGGEEYYFDPDDGYMYTGTHYVDGEEYNFGSTGVASKVQTRQSSYESKDIYDYAYIGNRNSDVFHHSWCSSVRKMKDYNKVGFDSRSEAINSGYRPCKNCKP